MLPPSSQNTTTTFKRYNSDNTDTRQNQVRIRNNSGTVMKSWQRSQSSPEGKVSQKELLQVEKYIFHLLMVPIYLSHLKLYILKNDKDFIANI